MDWRSRRKAMYIGGVVIFFVILLSYPTYQLLKREPTCFDGRKNQDELGVDCGGSCELICANQVSPLSLMWSRSFKVADGTYSSVAFIENPNFNAAILSVPYIFRLYDASNLLIAERRGQTYVSTDGITPIFEPRITTGVRGAVRTTFEFTGGIQWHELRDPKILTLVSQELLNQNTSPRINAVVHNDDVRSLSDIEVVAVVFGLDGNAIGASQTIIPSIGPDSDAPIFFTWPEPFSGQVGRIDIIPRIPPRQPGLLITTE